MSAAQTFSVIIPTYNRIGALEICLRAIGELAFPHEQFQVIVVNDGGAAIPAPLQATSRRALNIQFCEKANDGPATARNFGVTRAEGDWLVFTDDDCVPERTWLSELALAAEKFGECVLGGSVVNGVPDNSQAEASQLLFEHLYRYYHLSGRKRSQRPFFTSNNMALSRRAFEQLGGFQPGMRTGEDRELCARALAQGLALHYVPSARIAHYRPMTLLQYWRLHTSYGRGGYDFYRLQQARGVKKMEPEPSEFYTDLLLYPWRKTPRRDALRLSMLLALSQVANTYGFFRSMRSASRPNPKT